jgi:hypothetical protein
MDIFVVGRFTARLGSVTGVAQQVLQEIATLLNDAQNEIVAVSVSRGQMPGIHKTVDVAFGSASCFEQCIDGRAFVDVFSDELPPLPLTPTNWVVRKFWCIDQLTGLSVALSLLPYSLKGQLRGAHAQAGLRNGAT